MKISISPQYEHLRGDILKVVTGDYIASKVYCHKRNVVEKVCMQGKDYVVKTYKRPNFFNRLAYTYLRKSKAKRAFLNALHLLELGIETPAPVAYIEYCHWTLIAVIFFTILTQTRNAIILLLRTSTVCSSAKHLLHMP